MEKMLRFFCLPLVLCALICWFPVSVLGEDSSGQSLDSWVKNEGFLDLPTDKQLELLEKLAGQRSGDILFRAGMDCFKEEVQLRVKVIDARMDLKTLMDSFHWQKLRFHASKKIRVEGDMVFRNCSLQSVVEQLCRKYQLKTFYYGFRLYFVPAPEEGSADDDNVGFDEILSPVRVLEDADRHR